MNNCNCLLGLLLVTLLLLLVAGCIYGVGNDSGRVARKRTMEIVESVTGEENLWVQTDHGDIIVHGADTDKCRAKVIITGRSFSGEESEAIAAATEVSLTSLGKQMKIQIKMPELKQRESVIVSLNLTVPRTIATELRSVSGDIRVVGLDASVTACTTNGDIQLYQVAARQMDLKTFRGSINGEKLSGNLQASTTNGDIKLREVTAGHMTLETHSGLIEGKLCVENLQGSTINGDIKISYLSGETKAKDVQLSTHSGNIWMMVPEDYSAQVKASTHIGQIHTNLPLTVKGTIDKSVIGAIGDGEGQLNLQTRNGSITIKVQE